VILYPATYAHGSFAFNAHMNADGTENEDYVDTTVTIDRRRILTSYRDTRDALHLAQGGTLGRVHKGMTLIQLLGRIQAPDETQAASLSDRERQIMSAFDPAMCYQDSPSTEGAYAFDFSEATLDTSTYPTGIMALRYYCRPTERPSLEEKISEGGWRNYALSLVAPDPRCYEQTLGTVTLTPGSTSATCYNYGDVPSPLRATITMGGAGSGSFTISDGTLSFVLNLAGLSNGNVVVANMETCGPFGRGRRVTLNGADAFSRKTSGATTWLSGPGASSKTYTISNTTNVTSCVLEWGHARA
jgi:hypothetical protein